ncbi:serine/threonine-protein kinase ULK3 [Ixodes scapularis]
MAQLYDHKLPEYVFTEKLGQGTYATVFKAYHKTGARRVVAIKCISKSSLTKSATENLLTEIAILKKIKNEHIVELIDFQWNQHFIYLIMEYCSGGDLHRYIRANKRLRESIVRKFLQQLAKALQVLQEHNIAHMDLKPQNILLSSVRTPLLKLADFGFAQYLRAGDFASSLRGSPLYMAPEMLLSDHYDNKVDLWSVGIIMYECLFGSAPYSSPTFEEVAAKIRTNEPIKLPEGMAISDSCADLLLRLLERDPDRRINFEEFFTHPFVDLEHLPTPESFDKGVNLIQRAVAKDSEGSLREALHLYCMGLQYLLPVLQTETDLEKWKSLQAKVSEYLQRAEVLKSALKSKEALLIEDVQHGGANEFEDLCDRYPPLQTALLLVNAAKKLAVSNRLQDALRTYQDALDIAIPFTSNCRPEEREVLRTEAKKWLDAAELVKSYMTMQTLGVERTAPIRSESTCVLQ